MIRTYNELAALHNLSDRFRYLKLDGAVGNLTFGGHRELNQIFYRSPEWRTFRNRVILRDHGCELGLEPFEILTPIYIHHLNPLTVEDIVNRSPNLFDMNNAVCCSYDMHQAIHYGDLSVVSRYSLDERHAGDTCPWK